MSNKRKLLLNVFFLCSNVALSFSSLTLSPDYISSLSCSALDSIVYDIFDNDRLHDPAVKLIVDELVKQLKEKDCTTIAQGLNLSGFQYYTENEIITARKLFLEAEQISRNNSSLQHVYAHNQILLGLTHVTELQYNVAKLYFERAKDIYSSIDNTIGVVDALQNIGLVKIEDGKLEEAVQNLKEAEDICKQDEYCTHLGYIYHNLSRALLKSGNMNEAVKYLDLAETIWTNNNFHQGLFFVAMSRADLYQQQGDNDSQIFFMKKAIDLSERYQLDLRKHEPYKRIGNIYLSLHQAHNANEYYLKALDFSIDMSDADLEEISSKVINYYKRNNKGAKLEEVYERLIDFYRERELIANSKSDIIFNVEKNVNQRDDQNSELMTTLGNQKTVLTFVSLILGLISFFLIVIYSENKKRKALLQQVESQNVKLNNINNQLAKSTQTISTQNKQLEIQNESLKNFASIASHDLKSPARTIKSFVGLLRKKLGAQLDTSTSSILDVIDQTSHNMYDLIQDILNFSMVENDAIKITACKVTDVLGGVLSDMSNDITENNINIEIRKMPSSIQADKSKLKQLFANLVSNSIKYRHPERDCIIEVTHEENDAFHSFSVSDNGIGIEKDFQEKVFIMFEKRTDNRNIASNGIGLAICKKIVEIHKGTITVKSVAGEGSNFSFTIAKDLLKEVK